MDGRSVGSDVFAFGLFLLALALAFALLQGTALEGEPQPIALVLVVLPEDILAKVEVSFFSCVVIERQMALICA